jgi:protease I
MELEKRQIAILVEDLFEDLELFYPYYRLKEAGAEVTVLGTGKGLYQGKKGLSISEDARVGEADPATFDAVVIPGGYAPDHMRRHPAMVEFVRQIHDSGRFVAFICHAGWLPISADIVRGRKATSFRSIRDDMRNAGADWVDEAVVRDGNLISSRVPDDLPAFCRTLIEALSGD